MRVHDFSAQTRLMVVLNAQLKENQWDNLMEYEQAADRAGDLSWRRRCACGHLRAGLTAGFAANMPVGMGEESALLLPSGGEAREEELLTAFARLRIVRTRSFNTFLEGLCALSDMDMVVLSPYDSEALQLRLAALRARGNTVRLFVLEGGSR